MNPLQCKYTYEGNSKSKVPYFIHTERIPALSWQAWVVRTYIHHHTAVAVKFAPERLPINWQMNTKIAWESPCSSFSIMKHSWAHFTIEKTLVFHNTPDSKAESVTWKRKWWILFSAMFSEVCWLFSHLTSTINAGNSTETLGGCLAQETRMMIKWVHLFHDNAQLSLDLLGLKNSSTSTTQFWFAPSYFHIFSKMEKHLRGQHFHSN